MNTDPANWRVSGRDILAPHADGGDVLICRCATASVARVIVQLQEGNGNEIAALQSLLSDYRAYNNRLQRATERNRFLTAVRRAAEPTMRDRVQVTIRLRLPVSAELATALRLTDHSKGPWTSEVDGYQLRTYPIKTCYPEDLPGFARDLFAAVKLAKRMGKRIEIVRYK